VLIITLDSQELKFPTRQVDEFIQVMEFMSRKNPEVDHEELAVARRLKDKTESSGSRPPTEVLAIPIRLPLGHVLTALIAALSAALQSRAALQLEILALRHQIGVLQRSVKRPKLTTADRLLWAWLSSVWRDGGPGSSSSKASTVLGWHRKGFRLFGPGRFEVESAADQPCRRRFAN
jgi:hypothetical protein